MSFYNMKILKLKMDIPLIFPRAGPDPPDETRERAQCRLAQGPPPRKIQKLFFIKQFVRNKQHMRLLS